MKETFSKWQLDCGNFIDSWMEVAGTQCITLVSISPANGATAARSFDGPGDAVKWVAEQQNQGRNVYFEVNETRPDCVKKPSKSEIVAAVCRHADIDPLDDAYPFAEERARLIALAGVLAADRHVQPTFVIDSGNGLQALWVTVRETASDAVTVRVEAENRAINAALGGDAVHNLDRLLRLPATVNFPNRKKAAKGRQIAHAQVLSSSAAVYTVAEAAALGAQLDRLVRDTGLVRTKPAAGAAGTTVDNAAIKKLIAALRAAGADSIRDPAGLPMVLRTSLNAVLMVNTALKERWEGRMEGLAKANDRSALDFSLAALLKLESFSHLNAGLLLCACIHAKAILISGNPRRGYGM